MHRQITLKCSLKHTGIRDSNLSFITLILIAQLVIFIVRLSVDFILAFMKYRRELDIKRFAQAAGEQIHTGHPTHGYRWTAAHITSTYA